MGLSTVSWLESLVAEKLRSASWVSICSSSTEEICSYLNDIPYCDTASKPDFQTRVTSQALVACSLQERNAETALPPTTIQRVSFKCFREVDIGTFKLE